VGKTRIFYVKEEVVTVIWDARSCILAETYRCLGENYIYIRCICDLNPSELFKIQYKFICDFEIATRVRL